MLRLLLFCLLLWIPGPCSPVVYVWYHEACGAAGMCR